MTTKERVPNPRLPAGLYTPSTSDIAPPVDTSAQILPFQELRWEDFERLCLRLAEREGEPEHCQLYGQRGQAQKGIDIYARLPTGGYAVYQCRRVKDVSAKKIVQVVDDILEGAWAEQAVKLVFCTSASLTGTRLVDAVEAQATRLKALDKAFVSWDRDGLSRKLKDLPQIVHDFFGRPWVERFCGREVSAGLGARLDAREVKHLRQELHRFYSNVFTNHDAGALLAADSTQSIGLGERYVVPDVSECRELRDIVQARSMSRQDREGMDGTDGQRSQPRWNMFVTSRQRLALDDWLPQARQHLLAGVPGSGKSSTLRFLALDLLSVRPRFTEVARRWKTFIPIWVPFGNWVNRVELGKKPVPLSHLMESWLTDFDENERLWPLVKEALDDHRLVLLVDGLDEWSNESAAGIAFDQLKVFVAQRHCPLVATSRPAAIGRLGPPPGSWSLGELAPFSRAQQLDLILNAERRATEEAEAIIAKQRAESFIAEVEHVGGLQELTEVPFLLLLLWYLHRRDAHLPGGKQAALARLVDYLILDYPKRRRKAASVVWQEQFLSAAEVKAALGKLAFSIHESGRESIRVPDAVDLFRRHFADGHLGPGLEVALARRIADDLVREARQELGILVEFEPEAVGFFHRSVQEHLAGVYLHGLPRQAQLEYMQHAGAKPHWREVGLNLLHLASRVDEADELVEAIRVSARTPIDRLQLAPFLAEVAAGMFGCSSSLTRRLAAEAVSDIETGAWAPLREIVLNRLLPGLNSAPLHSLLREHVRTWLPCLQEDRSDVFDAATGWPEEAETEAMIWRGLFDEHTATARAAGRAYAVRCRGAEGGAEKLLNLLGKPVESGVRAVAIETLAAGWPEHPALLSVLAKALCSADPNVRLAARVIRVDRGLGNDEDLEDLLTLANPWTDVDYHRRGDIGTAFLRGWPANTRIRDLCLSVHGLSNDDGIDRGLAMWVLLSGYGGDPDVIDFCCRQIERERYPFLMLHHGAWRLLAQHFRDEPKIVVAIDSWLQTSLEHHEPEVSLAALVGRTEVGKRKLISVLLKSKWSWWPARSLLEGWGMDDKEVAEALITVARGRAEEAGRIAHLLPKILADRREIGKRLLSLLEDPGNTRPSLALNGVAELADEAVNPHAVEIAIERSKSPAGPHTGEIETALITFFHEDPRVRPIALEACRGKDEDQGIRLGVVAKAYGHDADVRAVVRERAAPLPAELRAICAQRLGQGVGDASLTVDLLEGYSSETDGTAGGAAARAWVRRRRELDASDEDAVVRAEAGIKVIGPEYDRRCQQALVALIELGRLDKFSTATDLTPGKPIHVALQTFIKPNTILADMVAEHWRDFVAACGPSFPERLSSGGAGIEVWDVLALYADRSPDARNAVLEIIESQGKLSANLLSFYAKVHPRSAGLLGQCIRGLTGGSVPFAEGWGIVTTAAEILGEHFGGDNEALKQVLSASGRLMEWEKLLVLAEGWPDCDELKERVRERAGREFREPAGVAVDLRISMAIATPGEAMGAIRDHLARLELSARYADRALGAVLRRVGRDDMLAEAMVSMVTDTAPAREIASFSRLISGCRPLPAETRTKCEGLLSRALEGDLTHLIGFDMMEGRRRPVAFALVDALGGRPR